MLALFPGRIGLGKHLGQVAGTFEGLDFTALHHGARHALGKTLFAEFLEYLGDVGLGRRGDPGGGTLPPTRIHAHVQGAVLHEAETALGIVELGRGHAQIQQHAIDLAGPATADEFIAQFGETALDDLEAGIFRGQGLAGGDRLGILVEAQQPPFSTQQAQHGPAVSAATEGAVQITAGRLDGQCLYGLVQENGDVVEDWVHGHRIKSRISSGIPPGSLIARRSASHTALQASSSHNWNLLS